MVSVKGDRRLWTADCGLRTADCGLRTRGKSRLRVKCKLQTKGKIQNGDRKLGVKCRMKSAYCRPGGKKTAGNTSALVEVRRTHENLVKMFAFFFSCSDRKACLLIDSPMILRNPLFIKEFCFNSKQ